MPPHSKKSARISAPTTFSMIHRAGLAVSRCRVESSIHPVPCRPLTFSEEWSWHGGLAWLRPVVDADDVEPGSVVAHRRTPGTAKQIQQPRPHFAAHLSQTANPW